MCYSVLFPCASFLMSDDALCGDVKSRGTVSSEVEKSFESPSFMALRNEKCRHIAFTLIGTR